MTEREKPKDVLWLLGAFHGWVNGEMRGTHSSPARTAFARVAVLLLVLAFAGPILWTALRSMPTLLVVVVAMSVVFRVLRWYLRRNW